MADISIEPKPRSPLPLILGLLALALIAFLLLRNRGGEDAVDETGPVVDTMPAATGAPAPAPPPPTATPGVVDSGPAGDTGAAAP
ncbi:MAG TPA: hypothetical protein VFR37_18480 [Longimicrobium sp.]|nr:hypothetical protein [Longimicrobium sp.]